MGNEWRTPVDGTFAMTLSLLLAGSLAAGPAILTAGLLLALQRGAVVIYRSSPAR